jgi:hypothetical protein
MPASVLRSIVALGVLCVLAPARLAQGAEGARATQPGPVTVQVLLLAENLSPNPDEYVEVNGRRYIYFNSPRLAAPARPLSEPRPRFPAGELPQQHGAVILQLMISERGELEQVFVVCSAPPFEKSAVDSVKGMRFRPALGPTGPVRSYLWAEFGYGRGFPCAAIRD